MEKALIKRHLNTIDFSMQIIQTKIEVVEDNCNDNIDFLPNKAYIDHLKDCICDLDTIRQEYQKELDK